MPGYDALRKDMIERQIKTRGVRDPLVLQAIARVAREHFVPRYLKEQAYRDCPLPIDAGQTMPQPHIVAYMIEALALKGRGRWFGLIIPISAMPGRPKCHAGASAIWASFARAGSAAKSTGSEWVRIVGPSQRRATGTGRWRSGRSGRHILKAMNGNSIFPVCRASSCRCAQDPGATLSRSFRNRVWNAPSGSSIAPRPSLPATISKPSFPASSTNTSGSTQPAR